MIIEVFFDVETKKLFSDIQTDNPKDLGVSVMSVYRRVLNSSHEEINGEMISFWDKEALLQPVLEESWKIFSEADRIIGFNSRHFDIPALFPYFGGAFEVMNHFDIMDIVKNRLGRKLSLNALVSETLGSVKTDVGTNAVVYWAKRDRESMEKLQHYCEADVHLTRDLYDFGMKNKYLRYIDKWNNKTIVEVDFSYPEKSKPPPQISLL